MAIAKGNKSEEVQDFKRYIGVSPMFVKGVNPNKKEHEALFNTTLDEDPSYVTDVTDNDGNKFKSARVQIVFQMAKDKYASDSELLEDFKNTENPKVSMALFIQNRPRVGASSGKTQIIDKYGRTAWATPNDLATHSIPVYSNGPADIDSNYRPAYVGEEELIHFIKVFLRIPDITVWDANLQKRVPNNKVKPEECECMLENIDNLFKGDFSEIKEAIGFMPMNRIKVLLGVRTDAETGRLYQTVYTRRFLDNKSSNYNSLNKEIQEMVQNALSNGRSVNTEYQVAPVHEYSVTPTTFSQDNTETPETPTEESTSGFPWD